MEAHEARLQVTWKGQQGDLRDPVHFEATDGDIKMWVQEAIRGGDIEGIDQDRLADFGDFVVDRFPAKDDLPNRLSVRPKVPFGR